MQTEANLPAHLHKVESQAGLARKHVEESRQRLIEAERVSAFWNDLTRHVAAGNPSHLLLIIRREAAYLEKLKQAKDPIAAVVEALYADADARARQGVTTFGRDFPEAVRKASLQIDNTSRHPKYTLKQGFIHVEVDERKYTAKVTPRDGGVTIMGMDVVPLVEHLKEEITRIFERKFDPESRLRTLYTAYAATLRAEGRPEGEEVPLRRVVNRMAKNLNRFAGDEFNVDLAQLVKTGQNTIDGRQMHLNHTRNARQGLLLHGLESGGYVGFISFKREDTQ